MIRYALRCTQDHRFESWFGSSADFDRLLSAGLVSCAVCGSPEVQKDLMAPSLAGAGAEAPDPAPTLSAPLSPAEQAMAELRRRIEARSENVGRDFAAEARRIHEGSSPDRPIIGEAKPSEARALIEDGIPVAPLPWSSRKSN
ncbi:MAG: DUF1178 family protein [Rhodobacteraceae bacterium]|nr:DUF1178 family protein [Paracoccaceae bacterium]MCB1402603.1 DUF1178 family protein [Paracoccaceae bacterium]MCC0065575.1 DUF1178 family protein [Rhodovulum sp.]